MISLGKKRFIEEWEPKCGDQAAILHWRSREAAVVLVAGGDPVNGSPHEIRMFRFMAMIYASLPLLADLDFARLSWNTAGVPIARAALIDQIIETMAKSLEG